MASVSNIACCFILLILQMGERVESSGILNIKAVFPSKAANSGATRLVLSGTLPEISDVTVCAWVNAAGTLKPKGNFIVSYAHGKAANELLFGVHPMQDDRVKFQISVRDKDAFITSNKFVPGEWHHLCFSWSSGKGRVTAYVDGHLAGKVESVEAGQTIRSGGALIVGQDQDIYNGKFDAEESWEGSIADLQIWDEVLKKETIEAMAQCQIHLDGNLVSWMKTPFRALDSVVLSRSHLCRRAAENIKSCN